MCGYGSGMRVKVMAKGHSVIGKRPSLSLIAEQYPPLVPLTGDM